MTLNHRGLSLAEILIAMAVMGIGLVGLAVVVPVAASALQEGNQMSAATFLAEQRLEQIRDMTWAVSGDCLGLSGATGVPMSTTCTRAASASLGSCVTSTPCATYPDEASPGSFAGYRRTTRISDCGTGLGCAGAVTDALRIVRVSVSYRALTGGAEAMKTVTVDWLVSRR